MRCKRGHCELVFSCVVKLYLLGTNGAPSKTSQRKWTTIYNLQRIHLLFAVLCISTTALQKFHQNSPASRHRKFFLYYYTFFANFSWHTGCSYKLSKINLVWGPLKCTKSNFNPVHLFLHFKSFCLVVLQLILASKLSELEPFEKLAQNGQFASKYEFSGKWLHAGAKCKKADPP